MGDLKADVALGVSIVSLITTIIWNWVGHRRAERHRMLALDESDLTEWESYASTLQRALIDLGRYRNYLEAELRGEAPSEKPMLPDPKHCPLIPDDIFDKAEKTFIEIQCVKTHLNVIEDRSGKKVEPEWIQETMKDTQKAFNVARAHLEELKAAILQGRSQQRKEKR